MDEEEGIRKNIHLNEKPDSITIKETAKGALYYEVKCYGNTKEDEDELVDRAKRIYDKLIEKMPTERPGVEDGSG